MLVLPALAAACWQVRRVRTLASAGALGLLPAIAWTVFALIYYGFPFPNTAYAKLAVGIDGGELRTQGVLYLIDSFDRDPLTLTAIAFTLLLAIAQRGLPARALAGGVALYLAYVVSIGGDFMAGRFLAVPLFLSTLIIARLVVRPTPVWISATAILVVVGSMASHAPLWSNSRFGDSAGSAAGIIDERGVYFRDKSLMRARRATFRNPDWPVARWRPPASVRVLDACGLMGAAGLDFGAYAYLLDECGLADPLLARLPAIYNPEWRPGHYRRMIPAGYRDSVERDANLIEDPALREYYEQLRLITRSDRLLSMRRARAIVAMNRGAYDHLIDRPFFRHAGSYLSLDEVAVPRAGQDDPASRALLKPVAIACEDRAGRRFLDVAVESDDAYLLTFLKQDEVVGTYEVGAVPEYRREPGLMSHTIDVPPGARAGGFDTIVVAPLAGNDRYAFGHLLLEGHAPTDPELYRRVAVRDGMAVR
jgi:arabinofuranosyltransferase